MVINCVAMIFLHIVVQLRRDSHFIVEIPYATNYGIMTPGHGETLHPSVDFYRNTLHICRGVLATYCATSLTWRVSDYHQANHSAINNAPPSHFPNLRDSSHVTTNFQFATHLETKMKQLCSQQNPFITHLVSPQTMCIGYSTTPHPVTYRNIPSILTQQWSSSIETYSKNLSVARLMNG